MKKVFLVFLALALISSLAITALAHSGGTDYQGGHTDHSTGEYHWHHGHSAHQHTDMDGDGDLDCPYDFVDSSGESSGGSSSDAHTANTPFPEPYVALPEFTAPDLPTFPPVPTTTPNRSDTARTASANSDPFDITGCILAVVVCIPIAAIIYAMRKERAEEEQARVERMKQEYLRRRKK